MSIVIAPLRKMLTESPKRKAPSGHPTGSRLGDCTAKLQLLRYPGYADPEKPNPRALLTWDQGHRIEAWLGEILRQAYPDAVGLEQEPFYFAVPLPDDSIETIAVNIAKRFGEEGALWGRVIPGFKPPSMRIDENGRTRIRPLARRGDGSIPKLGLVLDPVARRLWIPTFVDYVIRHPTWGLTVVECKAVSDYAFRRMAAGKLDYQKACQLVGMSEATQANVMVFAYRNETGHIAELVYLREGPHQIRIELTAPSGATEVYFVRGDKLAPEANAEDPEAEIEFPVDANYEAAEVWTPWDPRYLRDIRARILRALLWTPDQPLYREYGPTFTCEKCTGQGRILCRQCKGSGETPKTKKPCGPCQGAKLVSCPECEGRGFHPRIELPAFPCGYCPVIRKCYGEAGLVLEIGKKPVYYVEADAYQRLKLEYHPPTDYTLEAPEDEDEAEAGVALELQGA
jgi:hypothetical protein